MVDTYKNYIEKITLHVKLFSELKCLGELFKYIYIVLYTVALVRALFMLFFFFTSSALSDVLVVVIWTIRLILGRPGVGFLRIDVGTDGMG